MRFRVADYLPLVSLCILFAWSGWGAAGAHAQQEAPAGPIPSSMAGQRLLASLLNHHLLRDIEIAFASPTDDGTLYIWGLLSSESQRSLVELEGLKALSAEVEKRNLAGPFRAVNASGMMIVQNVAEPGLELAAALDGLLQKLPTGHFVRVQTYYPQQKTLALCGIVTSEAHRHLLNLGLTRLRGVHRVETDNLILADELAFSGDRSQLLNDAASALKTNQGVALVQISTRLLRRGQHTPSVWHLRAAGHLLCGENELAFGDLRMAIAAEPPGPRIPDSRRFEVLTRCQGAVRSQLEWLALAASYPRVAGLSRP